MQFAIKDLIQGKMPILALKQSNLIPPNAIDSIEFSTERVPFEGVVTKVSSNGEVEEFKLTKAIGELVVGTTIKVDLQVCDWDIKPLHD